MPFHCHVIMGCCRMTLLLPARRCLVQGLILSCPVYTPVWERVVSPTQLPQMYVQSTEINTLSKRARCLVQTSGDCLRLQVEIVSVVSVLN